MRLIRLSQLKLLAILLFFIAYPECRAEENHSFKLTGTYKCRPAEGTLAVKELAGGQVKFRLNSSGPVANRGK